LAVILVDRGQFADVYVAERHPIVGGGWVFVPFGDAPCFSCLDERVRVVGAVVELRRRYL
jgi:hypothetical protein